MNTRIKIKKGIITKTRRFWCQKCGGLTKSKQLIKQGYHGKYESGMQCLECKSTNYNYGYDCPKCGVEHDSWDMGCTKKDESECDLECGDCKYLRPISKTLIELGESSYNYGASMEGGSCYDWAETHKCWNCGTIYEFYNSNC